MGGFTLVGPNYVFQNLPNKIQCRCLGFTSKISTEVEELLRNDLTQTLKRETLPDELSEAMEGFHLGDEMRYTVKKRVSNDPEPYKLAPSGVPFGGTEVEVFDQTGGVRGTLPPDFDVSSEDGIIYKAASSLRKMRKLSKKASPWYRKE